MLIEVKGVQREGSTLSHMPDELQVLLTMVVVLGQETDRVVSAGVADQNRNSVTSSSHLTVAVMVYVKGRRIGTAHWNTALPPLLISNWFTGGTKINGRPEEIILRLID